MRVAIDLRWIEASGVGNYIQGIMPEILDTLRDLAVTGLGSKEQIRQYSWASAANFSIVDCDFRRYSLQEQLRLPSSIPVSTDLFFSPYYTIPILYPGRIAVTVHDMSHLVVDEIKNDFRKRIYAKTMFYAIRKKADLVFTVSEFSRLEYLRLTSGRDQRIVVTHNGVSEDWRTAASLPRTRRDPYFVCVGNIKPYKNVKRLVQAFLSIRSQIPQQLAIIGQSEGLITGESEDFFRSVRESDGRIRLYGHVSRTELMSLVAHSDGLIMPSLYEGFGLPPLEAMACGTPVVVSHAAAIPEVCGTAALYFDPLDVSDIAVKLLRFATDESLRETLRTQGLRRSEAFSWHECGRRTAMALRETLHADSRFGL